MSVMPTDQKRKTATVQVSATHAVRNFADLVNRAQYAGTRFVILRKGKPIAALVNPDELALLQQIDDAA
jgi:hypothetical protein